MAGTLVQHLSPVVVLVSPCGPSTIAAPARLLSILGAVKSRRTEAMQRVQAAYCMPWNSPKTLQHQLAPKNAAALAHIETNVRRLQCNQACCRDHTQQPQHRCSTRTFDSATAPSLFHSAPQLNDSCNREGSTGPPATPGTVGSTCGYSSDAAPVAVARDVRVNSMFWLVTSPLRQAEFNPAGRLVVPAHRTFASSILKKHEIIEPQEALHHLTLSAPVGNGAKQSHSTDSNPPPAQRSLEQCSNFSGAESGHARGTNRPCRWWIRDYWTLGIRFGGAGSPTFTTAAADATAAYCQTRALTNRLHGDFFQAPAPTGRFATTYGTLLSNLRLPSLLSVRQTTAAARVPWFRVTSVPSSAVVGLMASVRPLSSERFRNPPPVTPSSGRKPPTDRRTMRSRMKEWAEEHVARFSSGRERWRGKMKSRREELKALKGRLLLKSQKARRGVVALWHKYGYVGLSVYFGIYFLTLGSFFAASHFGALTGERVNRWAQNMRLEKHINGAVSDHVDSMWGKLAIAWIATKVVEPIRLFVAVTLTPTVVRLLRR